MMTRRCTTEILKKLRNVMKDTKYVTENLQAYIIPSCDAHQSEYIAACDERRHFICGFTGSRGTAVVTEEHAALWTDGRYFLQAEQQMDDNWTLMKENVEGTLSIGNWLNEVLADGSRVGVDPFLIDYDTGRQLVEKLQAKNNTLIPVQTNLVDVVWNNKPGKPSQPIDILDIKYTGKTFQDKLVTVREEMSKQKASTLVITALDEIAWLFNLRGSDIDFNPVFFSYVIVTMDCVYLFVDKEKLTESALKDLTSGANKDVHLEILPYTRTLDTLQTLLKAKQGSVWINKKSSFEIVSMIPQENRLLKITPVEVLKSIKNEAEIEGSKLAHVKDGAAICEFFHWLSHEISTNNVTEISAADKLESFKREYSDYMGLSFVTISSSGPNAAVIHYKPCPETDRKLSTSEIYLCDNGTQYRHGTTDVTRTWHFGEPSPMEKKCFTLVLKGHIALHQAVFPDKCTGHRLDALARQFLWASGLDFMHGTGHGVGAYLNVHEGPSGISYIYNCDDPGIQAGMILSIEPGYYEDEKFGIRIENLALVKNADTPHNFKGKQFLTFEPLTLVPYQAKLIDPSLLTADEIAWINNYHSLCLEKVGSLLQEQGKGDVLQWLTQAAQPLS